MNRHIRFSCIIISLVIIAILFVACAKPAPAQFEVVSLSVTPQEVVAGEKVNITAQVKNTGGTEGTYTAVLSIDGVKVEGKDIAILPGAAETASFILVRDKAGSYQVSVGESTSSFTVKPKLVAKEVELKYDDGSADGNFSGVRGGYLIEFIPPVAPFTIQKVRLFGTIRGMVMEKTFEVEIWDNDHKILFEKAYPTTMFPIDFSGPGNKPQVFRWVEIEVPNVEILDKFYVHVWRGDSEVRGVHIGVDENTQNEHCTITTRIKGAVKEVDPWQRQYLCDCWHKDKSKANWMIRVAGTMMVPEE